MRNLRCRRRSSSRARLGHRFETGEIVTQKCISLFVSTRLSEERGSCVSRRRRNRRLRARCIPVARRTRRPASRCRRRQVILHRVSCRVGGRHSRRRSEHCNGRAGAAACGSPATPPRAPAAALGQQPGPPVPWLASMPSALDEGPVGVSDHVRSRQQLRLPQSGLRDSRRIQAVAGPVIHNVVFDKEDLTVALASHDAVCLP